MTEWPSGCHDADSCARHKRCMYVRCQYERKDAAALKDAIEAACREVAEWPAWKRETAR